MRQVLLYLLLFGIAAADISCTYLDYIFQTNSCCESLGKDIPCLEAIPKIDFEDNIKEVRDKQKKMDEDVLPFVPRIIRKNMSDLCHNDVPIMGGVNYTDHADQEEWFNRPDLYCKGNENRLVIIPQYYISHCFFTVESNGVRYTAKIPHNPLMTTESYFEGTQSTSIVGFCQYDGDWETKSMMKISEVNRLVQLHNGIIYKTEAANNHQVKYPCTSELEKVIGDDHNRVAAIPLCSNFAYNNQVDCEQNVAVGAWDHTTILQMMNQWLSIDLSKEPNLKDIYFTKASGKSYLRFCLTTEYDNPSTYINGGNYGFDNSQDAHMVNPN